MRVRRACVRRVWVWDWPELVTSGLACEYDFLKVACECMERPVCAVHLYVRTSGMCRGCEIVHNVRVWREMQTCIHEG